MKRYIGTFLLIGSVAITILLIALQGEPEQESQAPTLMPVEVRTIYPMAVRDSVIGYGRLTPRWQTLLSSEVEGRVLRVSEAFLSGAEFKAGDILLEIDPVAYRSALNSARSNLQTAKRALAEEEQQAFVAAQMWEVSGFEGAPSDLSLRKPQLAEARANVAAAEAALRLAKRDLENTKVTAPYDGVVESRQVNKGDFVQRGSALGRIFDRTIFDIAVPLHEDEVARIAPALAKSGGAQDQAVTLKVGGGETNWTGTLVRIEQAINEETRQRRAIIEVGAQTGLIANQFLTVTFHGAMLENVLKISENSLAQDGTVWLVNRHNELRRFNAEIVFIRDGEAFVHSSFPQELGLRVATPHPSFLPGMKVEPLEFEPMPLPQSDVIGG